MWCNSIARVLAVAVFIAVPSATPGQFLSKYNAFADQMNTVAIELRDNTANRRDMVRAAKLWEQLYRDEGWLK